MAERPETAVLVDDREGIVSADDKVFESPEDEFCESEALIEGAERDISIPRPAPASIFRELDEEGVGGIGVIGIGRTGELVRLVCFDVEVMTMEGGGAPSGIVLALLILRDVFSVGGLPCTKVPKGAVLVEGAMRSETVL